MVEGSRSIERRGYRARIKTRNLPFFLSLSLSLSLSDARIPWKFEFHRRRGKRGEKRQKKKKKNKRRKKGGGRANVRWRNTGCKKRIRRGEEEEEGGNRERRSECNSEEINSHKI